MTEVPSAYLALHGYDMYAPPPQAAIDQFLNRAPGDFMGYERASGAAADPVMPGGSVGTAGVNGANFQNVKTPKGGWSSNPGQYAQQIQSAFGMSPNALAAFLGLNYSTNPWGDHPDGVKAAGAGANLLAPGNDPSQYLGGAIAKGQNAAQAFKAFTGQNLQAQELGYQFAGLGQYLNNLQGQKITPYQTNVSMQGLSDMPSLQRLMGQLGQYSSAGRTGAFEKILADRNADVPDWAPEMQKYLKEEQGLPYLPVEYLASPGMNSTDPTKPFFGAGESPAPLFNLTGNQVGERAFQRSLDNEEFFKNMAPLDWAQNHRAAGAPAPFESGLTFGSPVLRPGPSGGYTDAVYERSPVQGWTGGPQSITPEAMRIAGFTPEQLQNATGEDQLNMLRSLGGGLYNRWEGFGFPGANDGSTQPPLPGTMPEPPSITAAIQQLDTWWAQTYGVRPDQNDPNYRSERARIEAEARDLNNKFYWWQNQSYGPWGGNIAPEDLQRYEALRNDPTQQYYG